MAIINVRDRKLGSDDVAWGLGSYTYTDANGVTRTTPEINADSIPATYNTTVMDAMLDITAVPADAGELAAAITAMGSSRGTIYLRRGTYTFGANWTSPANVRLWVENGAVINQTGGTATINGPIEADSYQIFSWSGAGTFDLSGSPTAKIPITWFGAESGVTNDCSAVLTKMDGVLGGHQIMYFPYGTWRIASDLTLIGKAGDAAPWRMGYTLGGDGPMRSWIYIDVGAGNDGITFSSDSAGWWMRGLAFVGPANACQHGLVFDGSTMHSLEDVNLYMGATGYAISSIDANYVKINRMDIGHYYDVFTRGLALVRPANGISLYDATLAAGSNAWEAYGLSISGLTAGNGLYIRSSATSKWSGSIEACLYPVYIEGDPDNINYRPYDITLDTMYIVDSNVNGLTVDGVNNLTIINSNMDNSVGQKSSIKKAKYVNLVDSRFNNLEIDASCTNVVLDNTSCYQLVNYASESVFTTPAYNTSGQPNPFPSMRQGAVNAMRNSGFRRWTATVVDGWVDAAGAWTLCGTGQADTTNHRTDYCVAINTNGNAVVYPTYNLNSVEVAQFRGQMATFSYWIKIVDPGGGDEPTTYPILYGTRTVPAWVNGTAYVQGDGVTKVGGGGVVYKCITPGTSGGAEPVWDTTLNHITDDNGIEWMATGDQQLNTFGLQNLTSADFGLWKQQSMSIYIPPSTTAVSFNPALYAGTLGDVTYYIAEPAITPGGWTPRCFEPNSDDAQVSIQIAGCTISFGGAAPGAGTGWHQQGDIVFNTAAAGGGATASYWQCTVSGDGAGATWVAQLLP